MLRIGKCTKYFCWLFSTYSEDLVLLPFIATRLITKDIGDSLKAILEIDFVFGKWMLRISFAFFSKNAWKSRKMIIFAVFLIAPKTIMLEYVL